MRTKRQNVTKSKACNIILKPSLANEIERLSKKLKQSRNQTMINLIEIGLDCADKITASGLEFLVTVGRGEASAIRWAYLSGELNLDPIINKNKKDNKSQK